MTYVDDLGTPLKLGIESDGAMPRDTRVNKRWNETGSVKSETNV
jgi:hypothetical protein